MSEGAIVTIFALPSTVNVGCTELGLVFIWMIKFFYAIVRFRAVIASRTFPSFGYQMTHFRLICAERPPLILFLIVIVRTSLQVVTVRINFAGVYLEYSQVKEVAKVLCLLLLRLLRPVVVLLKYNPFSSHSFLALCTRI